MSIDSKINRQNRVREVLGKIYDQEPPYFREYLKKLKEDPASRVFVPLVEAYRRLGRLEEAIQMGQNGVQFHPDLMSGRVALAKCYLDKRLFQEAKEQLDYVVQRSPDNLLAQRLLGETHLIIGNRALAVHHFKMASLLSPSDVQLASKLYQLENTVASQTESGGARVADAPEEPSFELPEEDPFPEPAQHRSHEFTTFKNEFEKPQGGDLSERWAQLEGEDWAVDSGEPSPVDELLGVEEKDKSMEDGFQVEHISHIFQQEPEQKKGELTTETLGDLYYAQGLHDKSLRIFEKLYGIEPRVELLRKINLCRSQMGVDKETLVRKRQVQLLQDLLNQIKDQKEN